jgi:hypothetical protein
MAKTTEPAEAAEATERDLTEYLTKAATPSLEFYAEWLKDVVGYDTASSKNRDEAFARGVYLAVSLHRDFQTSPENQEFKEQQREAREAEAEQRRIEREEAKAAKEAEKEEQAAAKEAEREQREAAKAEKAAAKAEAGKTPATKAATTAKPARAAAAASTKPAPAARAARPTRKPQRATAEAPF